MSGPPGGRPDAIARALAALLGLLYRVHLVARADERGGWRVRAAVAAPHPYRDDGGMQLTSRMQGQGVWHLVVMTALLARHLRHVADAYVLDPECTSQRYSAGIRRIQARYPHAVTVDESTP